MRDNSNESDKFDPTTCRIFERNFIDDGSFEEAESTDLEEEDSRDDDDDQEEKQPRRADASDARRTLRAMRTPSQRYVPAPIELLTDDDDDDDDDEDEDLDAEGGCESSSSNDDVEIVSRSTTRSTAMLNQSTSSRMRTVSAH